MKSNCQFCGNCIIGRHHLAKLCLPCVQNEFGKSQKKAIAAVAKAVRKGDLKPAKNYKCIDCESDAFCYDHRDYDKPLDVVPVCRKCNFKRGSVKSKFFNSKHSNPNGSN
jgi:hypothetical protein